jgi:hypothetical protein
MDSITRKQTVKTTAVGVKAFNSWGYAREESEGIKDNIDVLMEETEGETAIEKLINMENENRVQVLKEFAAEIRNRKNGEDLSACTKNNYLDAIQRYVNTKSKRTFFYRDDNDFEQLRTTVKNYEIANYTSVDKRKTKSYAMDPFEEYEVSNIFRVIKLKIEMAVNEYDKLLFKMDYVVLGLAIFCELRASDLSKIETDAMCGDQIGYHHQAHVLPRVGCPPLPSRQ